MATPDKPIIILGAGLVGLTLAQGLKKHGFHFQVYDRDGSLDERPAGWGITVHWAFPALEACLPPELFAQIPSIQVNPGAIIGTLALLTYKHKVVSDCGLTSSR
jgi:glycine/D-amino acid oxidase-like deaminating enzyme